MNIKTKEANDQSIQVMISQLWNNYLLASQTRDRRTDASIRCGRETAYDIWNSLEDKLLPMTKEKEVQLTNRLQGLKKGTRSLDEYLREFKGVCDALAVVRKPVRDLDKVFQLAQVLGTKYQDFQVAMLLEPSYPSYNQFFLILQGYQHVHDRK